MTAAGMANAVYMDIGVKVMNSYLKGRSDAIKDIIKCIDILKDKSMSRKEMADLLLIYCNDSIDLINKTVEMNETHLRSKYLEYYTKMLENYADEVNVNDRDA